MTEQPLNTYCYLWQPGSDKFMEELMDYIKDTGEILIEQAHNHNHPGLYTAKAFLDMDKRYFRITITMRAWPYPDIKRSQVDEISKKNFENNIKDEGLNPGKIYET